MADRLSAFKRDEILYLSGTITSEHEGDIVKVKLKKKFLLVVKVIGYELRSQAFPEEGMR